MNDFSQMQQVSRRTFVTGLGAGFSTMFLWPRAVRAAGRALPAFSFVVVTDTHLGRGDNESAANLWIRTAKELVAAPGDFVLHLGDVVDGGREAQYPKYVATRDTIKKPVHEVPGNHDPPELFEKYIRKPIDTRFDHGGVRFLLFNNSHTDSHFGFISPEQITWLEAQCAEAVKQDLWIVLCAHVPVHFNQHPDRGWYVKPADGQTALYALLDRHRGHALAMFHGHFHNSIRGWDDHKPLHEICFPSNCYNQKRPLPERDATSYHLPELRAGYVLASFGPAGLTLTYKPSGFADTSEKVCPMGIFVGFSGNRTELN